MGNNYFRHFRNATTAHASEYADTIIVGVDSRYVFLDSTTRKSTMGVVLRPSGIQALFGIPGDEFLDQIVSLNDVIDLDVVAIRQRLIDAPNPDAKFCLLESFLCDLLDENFQPNPGIIYATQRIQSQKELCSISELADEVGYSRRRLSELFRNAAGIAPKGYARIQRFQNVLKKINKFSRSDWSQLALSCGYYDQAHFNHDFKALSGLTPSQYFKNRTGETNHLPA